MQTPQLPQPKLAKALGLTVDLYLKREDLSQYGSHKGRSIPHMIKTYFDQGIRNFVISSSGNAALAAIHTIVQHNKNNPSSALSLKIFVGEKINQAKLENLKTISNHQSAIQIDQVKNPKQMAFQMDKDSKAKNLRQSNDDLALIGYHSLATELNQIPNLEAIFVPTSSGTTAQALGEWFIERSASSADGHWPEIHIVQTEAVHPIAKEFDKKFTKQNESIAGAIVDNIAHRKNKVMEIIKKSNGSGWIVSDEEINEAIKLVKETTEIEISPNSALSVAGLKKAIKQGSKFSGPVVCLITGA